MYGYVCRGMKRGYHFGNSMAQLAVSTHVKKGQGRLEIKCLKSPHPCSDPEIPAPTLLPFLLGKVLHLGAWLLLEEREGSSGWEI